MRHLDSPFPAEWPVRRARDAYLAENGFTVEAYDARWTEGTVLGLKVSVPNTRHHRWAIMLHDLHHVVTGYGTDYAGEGEISAWEVRSGMRGLGPYVGSLVVFAAIGGALIAPRRVHAAWQHSNGSLHAMLGSVPPEQQRRTYEELLALTVGELRARLGVRRDGIAGRRRLHARAPVATSYASA